MLEKQQDLGENALNSEINNIKIQSILEQYLNYIEESEIKNSTFRNNLSRLIIDKWKEEKDRTQYSQ